MTQTTMTTTAVATTATGLRARIQAWTAARAVRRAQTKVYRTTFNQLNAMSDRDLADIGIARGMIDQVAHEAAYGN